MCLVNNGKSNVKLVSCTLWSGCTLSRFVKARTEDASGTYSIFMSIRMETRKWASVKSASPKCNKFYEEKLRGREHEKVFFPSPRSIFCYFYARLKNISCLCHGSGYFNVKGNDSV